MAQVIDKERIDFLEQLHQKTKRSKYGRVILRLSRTGRGWRLCSSSEGYETVREAIDAYMNAVGNGHSE